MKLYTVKDLGSLGPGSITTSMSRFATHVVVFDAVDQATGEVVRIRVNANSEQDAAAFLESLRQAPVFALSRWFTSVSANLNSVSLVTPHGVTRPEITARWGEPAQSTPPATAAAASQENPLGDSQEEYQI
jgi:hypothetical protein